MNVKALLLLEKIRKQVITCCADTKEPDDVEILLDQLKKMIEDMN